MSPATLAAILAAASTPLAAQGVADGRGLVALLGRVGDRIAQYYTRAQSIVCDERVRVLSLGHDNNPIGLGREIVYELRVAWGGAAEPGRFPEATVQRQIRTINGRPVDPDAEPECLDPSPVSPEPLSFLLPGRRQRFVFSLVGSTREGERRATMVDYEPRPREPGEVVFGDDCVSVQLPFWMAGRVWIDAETDDVLRLDERLVGLFEFRVPRADQRAFGAPTMTIERADSTTEYRQVRFEDPDETLMLPASIDSLVYWRGASPPRLRTTQSLSNCRRFLTDGRIVR